MAVHPDFLLREAVAASLDDIGCPPDETGIDEFLDALKSRGYVIVKEVDGIALGGSEE